MTDHLLATGLEPALLVPTNLLVLAVTVTVAPEPRAAVKKGCGDRHGSSDRDRHGGRDRDCQDDEVKAHDQDVDMNDEEY